MTEFVLTHAQRLQAAKLLATIPPGDASKKQGVTERQPLFLCPRTECVQNPASRIGSERRSAFLRTPPIGLPNYPNPHLMRQV